MTTQIKMTPLLRALVASRYFVILRDREIIRIATDINWDNLSKIFRGGEFESSTVAIQAIWDLVDAIPQPSLDR